MITLENVKNYLRVSSCDDDEFIRGLIPSAEAIVKAVGRVSEENWEAAKTEATPDLTRLRAQMEIAVYYTVGYLYEHRDEADHHELMITLRNLLFSVREGIL